MKLLANENFPIDSVHYLRNKGFDIISIGVEFFGIADEEVLRLAQEQERIILTFDRDYGTLIFKFDFKPQQGVIYLRLDSYDTDEPGKIIEYLLQIETFSTIRTLTVFDGSTIRQRKY